MSFVRHATAPFVRPLGCPARRRRGVPCPRYGRARKEHGGAAPPLPTR
ncbi:conserved domain protein [Eggerthella sp. HGA1]|nr:conserved domain protein [Eggerthella sp. HGA1]